MRVAESKQASKQARAHKCWESNRKMGADWVQGLGRRVWALGLGERNRKMGEDSNVNKRGRIAIKVTVALP